MFKWKSKHEGNRFEYTLVLEDNDEDAIGSVVVIENISNGDITVIAECEKIGYKYIEEHSDKKIIKLMVTNLKKFIKEEIEKVEMNKLSKWVTLTWNENGEPCEGRIEVEGVFEAEGIVIEIFKNWLYVRDEKAWKENSGYKKPIIMMISQGQLEYYRFKIIASRGSNNELFVVIEYNNKDFTEKRQLIGIVCHGYDNGKYAGITEDTKKEFFNWIKNSRGDWWPTIDVDIEKIKDSKQFDQGDMRSTKEPGTKNQIDTDEPISSEVLKDVKVRPLSNAYKNRIEQMREEGYVQRLQGWKKDMGL